jgi:hypothetical protein
VKVWKKPGDCLLAVRNEAPHSLKTKRTVHKVHGNVGVAFCFRQLEFSGRRAGKLKPSLVQK